MAIPKPKANKNAPSEEMQLNNGNMSDAAKEKYQERKRKNASFYEQTQQLSSDDPALQQRTPKFDELSREQQEQLLRNPQVQQYLREQQEQ